MDNCTKAGKTDIKVSSFVKKIWAAAVKISGRADIMWVDQPVADYQVKSSGGKLKLGGQPRSVSPCGIALVKGSPLEKAMTDAVKYRMANGYYTSILNQWGVADGAIKSSDVKVNDNSS